ncbi:UDP-galactopyranose mutase [Campylobacter jejuni]|uniref:UDP-galactopyranose mutase n=2 Tax=Campylobacter jejuni TaxID=197 RepID=A0A0S2CFG8_CAMJU|nr:UDP-galactopyranose mutase [Campylobacter jejuni]ALN43875.1 UDP-galactopyranose mutase [Campylobacter jejuni subsp. jejuni]EAH7988401.1 UDP-galactopyranose mutase [Campylobacter jejuni]EAH9643508.1 UDP-galactopyranose mutase [Campylobacter jejuni]EAI5330615.1 UDP-galactopyranose mutase [Campylobacter jejuni]EAI6922711.1 UDP-galactopyranose mutase [Campylobacter jejuni]
MKKVKNLIVGCGLSGAILAERLASKGQEVLIIDKREHIGGNIYDYKDQETNITIHKYGPHVFHTNIKEVWDYISRFTKWYFYFLKVKACIDGKEVNIPFNLDSLYKVFPKEIARNLEKKLIEKYSYNSKTTILELKNSNDKDLQFLADYIYKKVFLGYTVKQWGVKPEEIDSSVSARVPIYISKDDRYFQDTYQAIPKDGYTKMIENIINHPLIKVRLNTDFKDIKKDIEYERLFYTGAIDEFFDYKFGRLPYRSLDIVFETYDKEYMQSCVHINFPNNFDFTRSIEYKYYFNEKSKKTVLSYEYPCEYEEGKNERYYPIPNDENQKLYEKYLQEASKLENVHFLGRLGDYKYYDMDKTIERVLCFFRMTVK